MPRQAITKIKSKNSSNVDETFNIGANFSDIHYSDENEYSLKDFFDYMKQFLESPFFIQYSPNTPIVDSVRVWYETANFDD